MNPPDHPDLPASPDDAAAGAPTAPPGPITAAALPGPITAAPDPVDPALAPLLAPLAAAGPAPDAARAEALRGRLAQRLAASRQAEQGFVTARGLRAPAVAALPGVTARPLYRAADSARLRPGEPLRARRIELAAGARFDADALSEDLGLDAAALHREWLVLDGRVSVDADSLGARDYRVVPAGRRGGRCHSAGGAVLFLRESLRPAVPGETVATVRDAEAGWPGFAPGIFRRVLWQRDGEAALLYYAVPGASVPAHRHGHDEECLMVAGELFLDDLLLREGDYQLAPAGSGHRITATDTGVVIYAHGDADLAFVG